MIGLEPVQVKGSDQDRGIGYDLVAVKDALFDGGQVLGSEEPSGFSLHDSDLGHIFRTWSLVCL